MITVDHTKSHRLRLAFLVICLLMLNLGLSVVPQTAQAVNRTPVILIPGIAGSTYTTGAAYSYNGTSYGSNENVWVNVWQAALPGSDDYFDTLRLQADGDTPVVSNNNLAVSGIYNSAYSDIIDYMHRLGYIDNYNLFIFAYDWRRDVQNATYTKLDALVNLAKATAGTTQVDLVGHSMGGLVSRNYISNPSGAAKVRRLITLGTPYLGAPKFLKALLYGDQFGPSFLGLGLNPDEIKDLVQNMTGGWELLPSPSYWNFYNNANSGLISPYREDRDVDGDGYVRGAVSFNSLQTFLQRMGKNMTAANRANALHSRIDTTWLAGPKVSFINGTNQATVGQIRDYTGSCWSWYRYVPCSQTDALTVNGDGTVPYYSASLRDPSRGINLGGNASLYLVEREHGALVAYDTLLGIRTGDGPSLTVLGQILNNTRDPLGAQPEQDSVKAGGLSGYWISTTNDAQLEAYDANGNRTGLAKDAEYTYELGIAGSNVDTLGTTQFMYLPASGAYNLNLTATKDGSVDLKVRKLYGDSTLSSTIFLNVPVQVGSKAEVRLSEGNTPLFSLDSAGNGRNLTAVQPSAVLSGSADADVAAPTITLNSPRGSLEKGTLISWVASDELSGLNMQQGLIDPASKTPQVVGNGQYAQLSAGTHTLQVMAQDKAGNTSVQELKFTVR